MPSFGFLCPIEAQTITYHSSLLPRKFNSKIEVKTLKLFEIPYQLDLKIHKISKYHVIWFDQNFNNPSRERELSSLQKKVHGLSPKTTLKGVTTFA